MEFEPEPTCYGILRRDCASAIAVNIVPSDRASEGFMEAHPQANAGTHHIVEERAPNSTPIKLIASDDYEGPAPT